MPIPKALGILEEEASHNRLDPDIVRLFIDEKMYEMVDLEKEKAQELETGSDKAAGNGSLSS